ncbi:MAG TPA: stage III sporulation protein AD [Limnochordia bacterium]|nr:stage III sporulation protein AD [Limnochordia bacterium]
MEEIARFVAIGLVFAVLASYLKSQEKTLGSQLVILFIVAGLLYALGPLRRIVTVFVELAHKAQIQGAYIDVVLKAMGIAYLSAFGAALCRDAGEGSIAQLIELVGKLLILLLALPVVAGILEAVLGLLH